MKIGLDFDGVISDCGKLKSDVAKTLYGIDVPAAKFKKELVIGSGLLSAEQYRELQRKIYGTREFGFLMEPVPGMLRYLSELFLAGHTVTVVTSRDAAELDIAREWSEGYGFDLPFVGVGYGKNKAEAARGLDVYDDDLDKLAPLRGIVPHLFLFSWGYNSHIDESGVATRISSWQEFYETVRRLG